MKNTAESGWIFRIFSFLFFFSFFARRYCFCYYLSISWLKARLRYMHRWGALLQVATVHCCERCTTVKYPGKVTAELQSFWNFEGRKKCFRYTDIMCTYMNFNMFVLVIHTPHALSSRFHLFTLLGRLEFDYFYMVWRIQVAMMCRRAAADMSSDELAIYKWWHWSPSMSPRTRRSDKTLAWSSPSPAITSVKWLCHWGALPPLLTDHSITCKQGTGNIFVYFTDAISYSSLVNTHWLHVDVVKETWVMPKTLFTPVSTVL